MNRSSYPPRAGLLSVLNVLWWLLLFSTASMIAVLGVICLLPPNGVFAQTSRDRGTAIRTPDTNVNQAQLEAKSASQEKQVSGSDQNLIAKDERIEARLDAMSNRVEETGAHASQILNVIGLLIAFMSAMVGVGLWHSKHYIDRVAEHYKLDMKSFIREETDKQLSEIKSSLADQYQRLLTQTIDEMTSRETSLREGFEKYEASTKQRVESLFEGRLDMYQRIGAIIVERIPHILSKTLNLSSGSANGELPTQEEIDLAVYSQQEILRGLIQLESQNEEEVIAGCQTLSALKDRTSIPSLKQALSRWNKAGNPRVTSYIEATSEALESVE